MALNGIKKQILLNNVHTEVSQCSFNIARTNSSVLLKVVDTKIDRKNSRTETGAHRGAKKRTVSAVT